MGRKCYRKSKCAPCVPCETQVGNGLLNIAGIASKTIPATTAFPATGGQLNPIATTALYLFGALYTTGPTAADNPVNDPFYANFTNPTTYNLSNYLCGTCPPDECSNTTQAQFTSYVNYIISTGMDVSRLLTVCYGTNQLTNNTNTQNGLWTQAQQQQAISNFNNELINLINALNVNCTNSTNQGPSCCPPQPYYHHNNCGPYYHDNHYYYHAHNAAPPVTPAVLPPSVHIPAYARRAAPEPHALAVQPHNANAGCGCAGEPAPATESKVEAKTETKQPEKKKSRILNIFSKLRKKVSNKSSDA
jgi:hypothetical protein